MATNPLSAVNAAFTPSNSAQAAALASVNAAFAPAAPPSASSGGSFGASMSTPIGSSAPTSTGGTAPNVVNPLYQNPDGTPKADPSAPVTPATGGTPYAKALGTLAPGATPAPVAPPSDFFKSVYDQLAPVISAITGAETAAETAAYAAGTQTMNATSQALGSRGLAGSGEAIREAGNVNLMTAANVAQAKQSYATAMTDVAKFAIPEARTEYQNAIAQRNIDVNRNDVNAQNYITQQTTLAENSVKSLGKIGTSLDSLQQTDPNAYQALLEKYQGDVASMKADWLGAAAANRLVIGSPIINGDKITFITQNAITGEHSSETIDNPSGAPLTSNDVKVVPNFGLYVRDTSDPTGATWTHIGGANPYYAANQEATLASKNAMLVSRYGTAVNNITRQLFPTPTSNPINLYSNAQNYTTKLTEAYKKAISGTTKEKGPADLELLDSAVKINNGGQQITEAQINAIFNSLNIPGKATIEGGKLVGVSALLTDGQRQAIKDLADANIAAQKQNAINATNVIAERATRAGVPAQMLSTPEDIQALSAASNPAADAGAGGAITEIQSAGGTDNGDGTFTMPDGSVVDSGQ